MPQGTGRTTFADDSSGFVSGWTIAQILIILIIPAALFVFWYQYLRRLGREADEQFAAKSAVAARPAPASGREITCKRCGWRVRPPPGPIAATCPNCMSVL